MNDPSDIPGEGRVFHNALTHLREATPSQAMQVANRVAVTAALEPINRPWWQQTIAVPVPVAFATAASLLIATGTQFLPQETLVVEPPPVEISAPSVPHGQSPTKTLVASSEPRWEYYETNRYVSGIGIVDREFGYRIKE